MGLENYPEPSGKKLHRAIKGKARYILKDRFFLKMNNMKLSQRLNYFSFQVMISASWFYSKCKTRRIYINNHTHFLLSRNIIWPSGSEDYDSSTGLRAEGKGERICGQRPGFEFWLSPTLGNQDETPHLCETSSTQKLKVWLTYLVTYDSYILYTHKTCFVYWLAHYKNEAVS